ncbi:MAG: hypothetical protein N3G74_01970 [Candidatus Micrarchaeota archaeon]|nr:hypothetical protein [Candidatus Micrarchaeota archaeon]
MEKFRFMDEPGRSPESGKFGSPMQDKLEIVDFLPLIRKLEENKGKINKDERLENGIIAEKAINILVDRGARWCVKNSYMVWNPYLQIIRKKIVHKNEKITIEDMALIKTINAVLNPHKINETFSRNHNMSPHETYKFYLNDLKAKNPKW